MQIAWSLKKRLGAKGKNNQGKKPQTERLRRGEGSQASTTDPAAGKQKVKEVSATEPQNKLHHAKASL